MQELSQFIQNDDSEISQMHLTDTNHASEVPTSQSAIGGPQTRGKSVGSINPNTIINNNSFIITINKA